MMMAETGEMWKVAGSRSDIAATGPRPGRTPTRVPIRTPVKQNIRFPGSKAV